MDLSDPAKDVYDKYVDPFREMGGAEAVEAKLLSKRPQPTCPRCDSDDIDRSSTYRGEYRCKKCRHNWQVGGRDSRS